ncbi:MAG TPA: hypothetical protein VJ486_07715 [Geothrix sp.]|nr:hypothetical protein [Geothrix sp.]
MARHRLWILICLGCFFSGERYGMATAPYIPAAVSTSSKDGWPDLPQDIWQIKPSDYQDGAGAVVLQERVHFHRRSMERFRRLLVLAEPGRELAEFQLIGANVKKLEGRTVAPDGSTQAFVQNGDIVKSVLLSGKKENLDAVKVIPPGVTAHCVVDVRWSEPIDAEKRPVPEGYDYNLLLSLSGRAPVRMSELIFDEDVADIGWKKKFEVQAGQKYRQTTGEGYTSFTFEDIPARPKVPLASAADLRAPVANWFLVPQVREWLTWIGFPADKPVNALDGAAKTVFYKFLAEPVESKRDFKLELKIIGRDIEGSVKARAESLIRALRFRMKTIRELPSEPPRKSYEATMDAAWKRGWGTQIQICMVGFHLLRENGLDPSLVLAIDREESRLLDPNNIWQYDYVMLSVPDEKGEPVYLNPGSTFYPFGVPPWAQASQALVIYPGKAQLDWTGKILPLLPMPAESNPQKWSVVINPGGESDDYGISFQASGHAASQVRWNLFEQHAATLDKALAPLFENNGFRLRNASGTGTTDPWSDLALTVQGTLDHEGGRRRLIFPFPFLRAPFELPTHWPATRTINIHMPMKTLIDAEARLSWAGPLPDPQDLTPLQNQNAFGQVTWSAEVMDGKSGKEMVIKLVVKVGGLVGGSGLYPEVKAFSGWIQEALHRGVPAPRP